MLMQGKIRRLKRSRSSRISVLPVPLNSWKMISSIREPVSTSAVAMIVSDPPPSAFLAAPKKRRGFSIVGASVPPERILRPPFCMWLYARAIRVIESRKMIACLPHSIKRRARSATISATAMWFSAERSADDAAKVGDLLGALVDQEHDDVNVRRVDPDGVRHPFQERRLPGLRRRHDQASLAAADRSQQVDDAAAHLVRLGLELQPGVWIDRDELLEGR